MKNSNYYFKVVEDACELCGNKRYSSQKYGLHNWDASICTLRYPNFKKVTFEKKAELKFKKKK